jgi:hypothetical protein
MSVRLPSLLLLSLLSLPAFAQGHAASEQVYIGGSWGTSRWDVGFQPGLSTDPQTHAWRAWAGYDHRFFAVELGWIKFGQVLRRDATGAEGRLLARGLSADFLLKLPLGAVEPFIKAGPVLARTQVRGGLFGGSADTFNDEETKLGLGVQLKLGTHGLLRAEYERYSMGGHLGVGGVNVWTVGAGIRF